MRSCAGPLIDVWPNERAGLTATNPSEPLARNAPDMGNWTYTSSAHASAPSTRAAPTASQASLADDEQTFRAILLEYGPSMRRVARVYAAKDGEEEDLYQEMQFQVWRSLASFRAQSSLSTWVYRVALNTALKHRRRARRRVRPTAALEHVHAHSVAAPRRQEAILEDFLASLGAIDRSVLLLYMEGLSQDHIGDVVGMNEGAVAVRIHRIKRAFQQRYAEE